MDKEDAINKGKELFIKEIRRRKFSINEVNNNIKNILENLKINDENEMYLGIGTGKFSPIMVVNLAFKEDNNKEDLLLDKISKNSHTVVNIDDEIIVNGINNVKVTTAKCCKPIKGDEIIGYISRGNGIIVHCKNCHNLSMLEDRFIDVKWNDNIDRKFETVINIYTTKKDNLLLDIINKTSSLNIGISKINTINNIDNNIYELTINVKDLDVLKKYITLINQDSNILKIERVFN